jgi:hypothetical protein
MTKTCPHCKATFDCSHDNLTDCHCVTVPLDEQQLAYIRENYDDCLCNACLQNIIYSFYALGINPKFKISV